MNIMFKLEHFTDVVLKEANEKREQIQQEMEDELNLACMQAKEKALKNQDEILKLEMYKIEQSKNKQLRKAETEARKVMAKLRNEKINEIFIEVKDGVYEFMKTDEYRELLLKGIKEHREQYDNFIVYVTKNDMKHCDFIKQHIDVMMEESEDDFIGGYKIKLNFKNAVIDNSYERKLEEARKDFNLFNVS